MLIPYQIIDLQQKNRISITKQIKPMLDEILSYMSENYLIVTELIVFAIVIQTSNAGMFLYDNQTKKHLFLFNVAGVFFSLNNNLLCANTAVFLMKIVILQIFVMDVVVDYRKYIVKIATKNTHLAKNTQWRLIYLIILILLTLFSIIGFLWAINTDLYLQLLKFPELPIMLTLILFGFYIVYISDYLFKKFTQSTDVNSINTIRRKIFHFVPVGLLPILAWIQYQLFTLMVFGAFYLFWLVEVVRYFGKIARREGQKLLQNNIIQDDNQESKLQNLDLETHINTSKLHKMIKISDKFNQKFSQLPLITWMQELNSSRQPHFWFTHLSLILGLSITYIYYHTQQYQTQLEYLNISIKQNISIILIIADAFAAIIGRKYGKPNHRIPYTNGKTIEGYFGFVFTMVGLVLLVYFCVYWWNGVSFGQIQYLLVIVSGVFCGLGELFSGDLDNVVIGSVFIFVESIYRFIVIYFYQ